MLWSCIGIPTTAAFPTNRLAASPVDLVKVISNCPAASIVTTATTTRKTHRKNLRFARIRSSHRFTGNENRARLLKLHHLAAERKSVLSATTDLSTMRSPRILSQVQWRRNVLTFTLPILGGSLDLDWRSIGLSVATGRDVLPVGNDDGRTAGGVEESLFVISSISTTPRRGEVWIYSIPNSLRR